MVMAILSLFMRNQILLVEEILEAEENLPAL